MLKPPYTNGIMDLTEEQKSDIRKKLLEIKSRPPLLNEYGNDETLDTFNLVATYNKENDLKINGDTAEFLLN